MGAVFLAQVLSLDREFAIKVSHPSIIRVHAVEDHHGLLAFVMQFVDGAQRG